MFSYGKTAPLNFTDWSGLSVRNNSQSTIYVKRENDCKTVAVPPGGFFPDAQDGLALPSIRADWVYKNVNGVNLIVNADGSISTSGIMSMVKQNAAELMGRAGWQDENWQKSLQASGDTGWDNLFKRSKPAEKSGPKDEECKK